MQKVFTLLLVLTLAACVEYPSAAQPAPLTPTPTQTAPATATASNTATAAEVCTVTAAEALHVRSGAGVAFGVIGYLYAGDIVTIQSTRGNWYEVTIAHGEGWINSNYCKE